MAEREPSLAGGTLGVGIAEVFAGAEILAGMAKDADASVERAQTAPSSLTFEQVRSQFDGFFASCERMAGGLIGWTEIALKLDQAGMVRDDVLRMCLVSLQFTERFLAIRVGGMRDTLRASPCPELCVLWNEKVDNRYEGMLDRIDDLSETIALGFSSAFQHEVAASFAEFLQDT